MLQFHNAILVNFIILFHPFRMHSNQPMSHSNQAEELGIDNFAVLTGLFRIKTKVLSQHGHYISNYEQRDDHLRQVASGKAGHERYLEENV